MSVKMYRCNVRNVAADHKLKHFIKEVKVIKWIIVGFCKVYNKEKNLSNLTTFRNCQSCALTRLFVDVIKAVLIETKNKLISQLIISTYYLSHYLALSFVIKFVFLMSSLFHLLNFDKRISSSFCLFRGLVDQSGLIYMYLLPLRFLKEYTHGSYAITFPEIY